MDASTKYVGDKELKEKIREQSPNRGTDSDDCGKSETPHREARPRPKGSDCGPD
jgi:hypothetical protein